MKTIKLNLTGMSCAHCENAVIKAVSDLKGVKKVTASAKDNSAEITFDEKKQNINNIIDTIQKSGYEAGEN